MSAPTRRNDTGRVVWYRRGRLLRETRPARKNSFVGFVENYRLLFCPPQDIVVHNLGYTIIYYFQWISSISARMAAGSARDADFFSSGFFRQGMVYYIYKGFSEAQRQISGYREPNFRPLPQAVREVGGYCRRFDCAASGTDSPRHQCAHW